MAEKVLIIGDSIIDKDVNLRAIGLSLESPTMKTAFVNENINYGGAANVAKYASQFGLNVTFVTCMSKTSENDFLKVAKLKLVNLSDKVENEKTRFYISHGDERYKYLQINNINKECVVSNIDLNMNDYDIVAFSDYRCGLISQQMISKALKSTAVTFAASQVSSCKSNFDKYINMDHLVCNKNESKFFARRKNVIITNGAKGCESNGEIYKCPVVEDPKNIIGAGDCFYAAFLAYGNAMKANRVASAYVGGNLSDYVKKINRS